MDGRSSVINVLVGVAMGGCVPIVGAIALTQAHPDFVWFDHFLTIILLCIFCAGIGVLVNLPWSEIHSHADHRTPSHSLHNQKHEAHADAGEQHQEEYSEPNENTSHRKQRTTASASFAMSRREAFRTLELELDADAATVRTAFRRLAREHHPDHATTQGEEAVAQATQKFQRVRAAYEVLLADDAA